MNIQKKCRKTQKLFLHSPPLRNSRNLPASFHGLRKEYLPPQPGDVERTYADVTKAVKELGYNPGTTIQAGLAKFITWLRQNS